MNRCVKILRTFLIATSLLLAVGSSGSLTAQSAPRDFRLLAESPQFWELVDHNAKLSVVGTGFGFTEGPVWDEAGFLLSLIHI